MELMHVRRLTVGLWLAAATSAAGSAQHVSPDEIVGGPLTGPMPFLNTAVTPTLRVASSSID
jgi:hypothetical protein